MVDKRPVEFYDVQFIGAGQKMARQSATARTDLNHTVGVFAAGR